MNSEFHKSVLIQEILEGLQVDSGKRFIDATVGGGGHATEIIQRGAQILGIDQDTAAITESTKCLSGIDPSGEQWKLVHGNFSDIRRIAHVEKFEAVDGVLFDLGVSTYQIKKSGRGFTFEKEEKLDMRMNEKENRYSAYDVVNAVSERELYEIFAQFGEEERAWPIARAIVRARSIKPIQTTTALQKIIAGVYKTKRIHGVNPATKVFQAIRIAVNQELAVLKKAIPDSFTLVKKGGRIAVISFHSLEDRIVKQLFKQSSMHIVTKKPIRPSQKEIYANPKARSARLRIAQKI